MYMKFESILFGSLDVSQKRRNINTEREREGGEDRGEIFGIFFVLHFEKRVICQRRVIRIARTY